MNHHRFRTRLARGRACAVVAFCVALGLAHGADRPNVILILADDLAFGDLSARNGGRSRTPRLDQLLQESVSFRQAYAGSPVCAPSRAALMTGRSPHRTGSVTLNQRKFPELTRLRLDETTIADRFSANGYTTGLVGKWHSGPGEAYHPRNRGFDEFVGFHDSWDIQTYFQYRLEIAGESREFEDGQYLTDVFTEHAIDFVRRHREEPFFLHLCHYAPHRPLSAPEEVIARYRAEGIAEKTAKVYAMIEIMDAGIGRLVDELDALGLAEQTLVIFTSDNGPDPLVGDRFNDGLRGTKYQVHEGGIRVPFLVRWKGTLERARRGEGIHFTDVVPTLVELCGLQAPPQGKPRDGASFAGLLSPRFESSELPARRYWQWNRAEPVYSHNAAVREGDWKLVRPFVTRGIPGGKSAREPRLYDLTRDPAESRDVADQHPELVERLVRELDRWCEEVETDRLRP